MVDEAFVTEIWCQSDNTSSCSEPATWGESELKFGKNAEIE